MDNNSSYPTTCSSYTDGILSFMNNARKRGEYCEMVFTVGDERVFGSRAVLAASSPYARSMFSGNFQESSTTIAEVNLDCIVQRIENVELCINALYEGKITLTRENIYDVFYIASFLILDNILNCCVSFALEDLDLDNVFNYYSITKIHLLPILKERVVSILRSRFHDALIFLPEFESLDIEVIKELFEMGVHKHCDLKTLETCLGTRYGELGDHVMSGIINTSSALQLPEPTEVDSSWKDEDPADVASSTNFTSTHHCLALVSKMGPNDEDSEITVDSHPVPSTTQGISIAIFDIQRSIWLTAGETNLPFPEDEAWKCEFVYNSLVFLNHRLPFGFSLNLKPLEWSKFSIESILLCMKDPLADMTPVEINGSLFILVTSSTLSNTSHMWIKKLKYFLITPEYNCILLHEDIKHCHHVTDISLVGSSNSVACFCESSLLGALELNNQSGIFVEDTHTFNVITGESQNIVGTFSVNVPAYLVVDDTCIRVVHGMRSQVICITSNSGPGLWIETHGNDTTDRGHADGETCNSSVCKNGKIWTVGVRSKLCNYLSLRDYEQHNRLKLSHHPPPPFMEVMYFNSGTLDDKIVHDFNQAKFVCPSQNLKHTTEITYQLKCTGDF